MPQLIALMARLQANLGSMVGAILADLRPHRMRTLCQSVVSEFGIGRAHVQFQTVGWLCDNFEAAL